MTMPNDREAARALAEKLLPCDGRLRGEQHKDMICACNYRDAVATALQAALHAQAQAGRVEELEATIDRADEHTAGLMARIEKLEAALRRHGVHRLACNTRLGNPCNCGLAEALGEG